MILSIVKGEATEESGGEGDSNPGTSFGSYNGLAIPRFHCLVFGRKDLARVNCPTLVQNTPIWGLLCNYCATRIFQRFVTPMYAHHER